MYTILTDIIVWYSDRNDGTCFNATRRIINQWIINILWPRGNADIVKQKSGGQKLTTTQPNLFVRSSYASELHISRQTFIVLVVSACNKIQLTEFFQWSLICDLIGSKFIAFHSTFFYWVFLLDLYSWYFVVLGNSKYKNKFYYLFFLYCAPYLFHRDIFVD